MNGPPHPVPQELDGVPAISDTSAIFDRSESRDVMSKTWKVRRSPRFDAPHQIVVLVWSDVLDADTERDAALTSLGMCQTYFRMSGVRYLQNGGAIPFVLLRDRVE